MLEGTECINDFITFAIDTTKFAPSWREVPICAEVVARTLADESDSALTTWFSCHSVAELRGTGK